MSSAPEGAAVGCSGCFRLMGPKTSILKPLLCGACKTSYYCGIECQKKHWPEHKPFCKARRRGERYAEETALAEPRQAALMSDFDAYTDLISLDVALLALRSAFRFGHPGQLNSTHYLSLTFLYDSRGAGKALQERFEFAHWELVEFDSQDIDRRGSGWPTRAELAERRHDKELVEGTMNGFIEFMANDVNDKDAQSVSTIRRDLGVEVSALSFLRHKEKGPISILPLNKMWDDTLNRALTRSPKYMRPDLMILELLMAVGEEMAIKALRSSWGHDPGMLEAALSRVKIAVAQGYLKGGPGVRGSVVIVRE